MNKAIKNIKINKLIVINIFFESVCDSTHEKFLFNSTIRDRY